MNKNYSIIKTDTEFNEALNHLESVEYVAYDTETTGLNVRKDKVIGLAFTGSEGVGYYLPVYYWNSDELKVYSDNSESWSRSILEVLLDKKLIMHNASFDCRITKSNYNVDLLSALHCDTILLKHTVDEERPFGLKDIAKKIQTQIGLDVEKTANKEQVEMIESIKANGGSVTKDKYELYKADMEKIGIYACADVDLTLRVFSYYSRILEAEKLENFFYKDEVMPLLKHVTIPMEERGVPVDVESLVLAKEEIVNDIEKLEGEIQDKIKPLLPEFEKWYLWLKFPPRRSGSFAQALAEHVKLDLPRTSSGRFSLAESSLEALEPSPYRDFLLGGDYLDEDLVRQVQLNMFEQADEKHMFNLASKHHLKKLFFEILEEKPISKTDKGNPQVDHLFLQSIKDKYDWMPLLLDYNKLNKLKGSYIDRILEEQEDGVFYPRFNQHRTISGRYGSDIQQLPRPMEEGEGSDLVRKHNNKIRKFFISGDGYAFVDADYVSLEPHVFAHVSGDEGLRDIFRSDRDFYSTIAIATESLEGVSADKKADNYLGKVNKPLRQKAKAYALGIPYGLESFKLSKTLDISQDEAQRLIDNYLNAYPKLKAWMDRSNELCITVGKVQSEAGRVRHMSTAKKIWYAHGEDILDSLKLWKKYNDAPKKYASMKYLRRQMKNYLNNAKNFQIQSLAASITNRACIAIARELKRKGIDGYICCQIHDQIVVRVPRERADEWRNIVQFLMENTYKISLKLEAPAEIGYNLYEAH
jgi:DNA polymerase I-like protein with 3'-5' exonuclease and polymerase domains